MSHICCVTSLECNTVNTDMYTCGSCGKKFSTICTLHQHFTMHNEGGAYYYDDVIKVAFPKFDSICTSTQTDELLTNFLQQLEFAKKFGHVTGSKFEDVTKTDKAAVDADCDVKGIKPLNKESSHFNELEGNDEQVGLESRYSKRRNKRFCVKENLDSAGTPAVKKLANMTNRNDTAFGNESDNDSAGRTQCHAVRSCSVRLRRLSGTDGSFIEGPKKISCQVSCEPKLLRKTGHSSESVAKEDIPGAKPSDGVSKVIDIIDDEEEDDGSFINYSVEHVDNRSLQKTKKNENIKDSNFKMPLTVLEYRKTKGTVQVSKLKTKKKKLSHNDVHSEQSLTNERDKSSEKEFPSNKNLKELKENHKDTLESDTDDEQIDLEMLREKEYFYGKISAGDFEIQRSKPKGVFYRGEKNEHNRVFVDVTWMPVPEWTNDTVGSLMGYIDEMESSNGKEFNPSDKDENYHTKKDIKRPRRKKKYGQTSSPVCNICGKSFKSNCHLKGHMNIHLGLKPYMCQYCGKSYYKMMALQTHQLHVHSDKTTWMTCRICGNKSFPTASRLRVHEETHSTEYKHICHKCDKSYKSAKLLKDHVKYAHSQKKFRCNNCKKSFDSEEERETHKKAKHNQVDKCRFCLRVFTCSRSKDRHEKIHLGVKPHECHICLRRFLQKTPFWLHMEKYHDLTKADLIQLFPEKHLDRNRQHLIEDMLPVEQLDGAVRGTDNIPIHTEYNESGKFL